MLALLSRQKLNHEPLREKDRWGTSIKHLFIIIETFRAATLFYTIEDGLAVRNILSIL